MSEITQIRRGHRAVKLSWSKLITLTKKQRESALLKLEQARLAEGHAELIIAAKAERKRQHIARMKEVAASKKRR